MKTTRKNKRPKPLSWDPIRVGATYCSPACGRGCKWSEFRRATDLADRLVAKLGKGWKPRVWENLGWFWEVAHKSGVIIHPPHYGGDSFSAELRAADRQWFGDPKKTARDALQSLRDRLQVNADAFQAAIDAVDKIPL